MNALTLETEGDRFIVVKRRFAAPPAALYRAHMEPELIQKWLLGPDGWTMPVFINEQKVGGKLRYEWTNGSESFLPDPTPDNLCETTFTADGTGTLLVCRMTLPDEETRKIVLSTGMEEGMELSYQRLEGML